MEWPDEMELAPHVVLTHMDISSAGLRAVMLLKEALRESAGASQQVKTKQGKIMHARAEDGVWEAIPKAWQDCRDVAENTESSSHALEVCTLYDGQQRPAVTLLSFNATLPPSHVTAVALDVVRSLIVHKVAAPLLGLHPVGKD